MRTKREVREWTKSQKEQGRTVVLVPTMGGLHKGHVQLIEHAATLAPDAAVLVSIYVNPTQFAPNEDFDSYPRDVSADLSAIGASAAPDNAACVAAFVPHDLYANDGGADDQSEDALPLSVQTHVVPNGALAAGLCGQSRPHFFQGVCTVVLKLLNCTQADVAVFGEKDFQQLTIVREMVRQLDVPVRIESGPLLRDDDSLALSSRNLNLPPDARAAAARSLPVSMLAFAKAAADDAARPLPADAPAPPPTWSVASGIEAEVARACADEGGDVDYVSVVDGTTLQPLGGVKDGHSSHPLPEGWTRALPPGARLCAAVTYGGVRLLDNVELRASGESGM